MTEIEKAIEFLEEEELARVEAGLDEEARCYGMAVMALRKEQHETSHI